MRRKSEFVLLFRRQLSIRSTEFPANSGKAQPSSKTILPIPFLTQGTYNQEAQLGCDSILAYITQGMVEMARRGLDGGFETVIFLIDLARQKKRTSISAPGPLFRPKRPTYYLHQSEILFTEGDAVEHKNKPCLLSMSQVSGSLPSSRSRLLVARIIGLKLILFLQYKPQGLCHKKQVRDASLYGPSRSRTASEIPFTAAKKRTLEVYSPTHGPDLSDLGYRLSGG